MTSHHLKLLNANCRAWCLASYLTAFTDWTVNFDCITNLILLHYVVKVENILKGNLDSIPSPSVKIQIMSGKVCLRQNLAGHCQQTFENKKFVDITQQCFALLPLVNFPANSLNFH